LHQINNNNSSNLNNKIYQKMK